MSHFSVLVIGADVEGQLAKFDENLENNSPYIEEIDVTANARAAYERAAPTERSSFLEFAKNYYGYEELSIDNPLDLEGKHSNGYVRVVNGEADKVIERTNPNAKWDWYQVGGRWDGYFKLKSGDVANTAFKGDIDFAAMEAEAAAEANAIYDKLDAVLASLQMSLADVPTWESILDKHGKVFDTARDEYWALPAIAAMQAAHLMPWNVTPQKHYGPNREAFVKRNSIGCYIPYAVVRNGEWMARGEMGWFGYSDDKVTQDDWNAQAAKLIAELSDDTVLTIVDCHI